MSEHEPPDPESGPPSPPEPPHTLSEEFREAVEKVEDAVEEVVEHVPQPVRWTIGKIVGLVALGFVGLVVLAVVTAVLYVSNRTEWAAQELTVLLNQMLATRSNVSLSISDIKGNPFTGVRVLKPSVRFRDGSGPTLIEAPAMRLSYSAWELMTGARRAISVEFERPVVRLEKTADGKWHLPTWKSGSAAKGAGRGYDVTVRIHDGTVRLPGSGEPIAGLELDANALTGTQTQLAIRRMSWKSGPYATPLEQFRADVIAGDSVTIRVSELRTAPLALHGEARWKKGETMHHVEATVERVRWSWLATVFKNKTLDVPGEGQATIVADGGGSWKGRFRSRAVWTDLPLEAEGNFTWQDAHLTLDPLNGTSLAGDLQGKVAWSKQGWEVGGTAQNADPAHWTAIGLKDWPAGKLNGRFRYQVDTRGPPRARLVAQLEGSEWTGWRADSGGVIIDFPAVGADSFRVRAIRRGGEMTLAGASREGGWTGQYAVSRLPLDEWPDGRASGIRGLLTRASGTVTGHSGTLDVTGSLEGTGTDWLGVHAASWRMNDVKGRMLPTADLTTLARLEDVTFLGVHFDSVQSPAHLGDQTLAFQNLAAQGGDTLLTMTGDTRWDTHGWHLEASQAAVRSSQLDWAVEPPLVLSGDSHGVTFDRMTAHDSTSALVITGRWAGPGGTYDWTGRGTGLDLARLGLPIEWRLRGRADATLHVWGASGDPRWSLEAAASKPGAQAHAADSLRLRLGGAPSRLDVEEALLAVDGGTLKANGSIGGMPRAWPDTLTADGVQRWIQDAGQWSGTVRADQLAIDSFGQLFPGAVGWRGRLNGAVDVRGKPEAPVLDLTADAQPLKWRDFQVDVVHTHALYRDGRLEVPEFRMTRGEVNSTVKGSMPLRLALGHPPELPDQPMEWTAHLPNGDLALLPLFVSQIGFASGRFDVDATMRGTAKQPDLSGTARIRQGKFRLGGRDEQVEDVYADLTLDESKVTLDTLAARQTSRQRVPGTVRGHGELLLDHLALKGYHFDLSLRDFTALEEGLYAVQFDGNFVVTEGPRVGRQIIPRVEGNVEVQRGYVFFDFANQSEVQMVAATTQPLYWTYRLHLSATNNLIWKPSNANIEFSADLDLTQTVDSLLIYGDVRALRGEYYFLSNRFTIQQADLTFDNVGGVNPQIDAVAETQMPRLSVPTTTSTVQLGVSDERGLERVTVTITGRAREPVINFGSESNWDEPQILRALTLGSPTGNVSLGTLGDPLDSYLTQALNRQLSQDLSQMFRGYLNEWEVARETGGLVQGTGGVLFKVGIPLSRELQVRYGQRVPGLDRTSENVAGGSIERDIEAEYRLNRFFYVTSELTQRRTTVIGGTSTVSGTPDFNVNLKARWEY